tara:strand:+ start:204 stop:671 length:468 start_codon:yes stop_codon:yes gene_type:complete
MSNTTFIPSGETDLNRVWHVIDCSGLTLGRASTAIAGILQGKHKTQYTPGTDMGDYVILVNAGALTMGDLEGHTYVFSPGRPGSSLKFRSVLDDFPKRIIENCIKNMMATGPAKRAMPTRLKVYETPNHPHMAQKPILLSHNNNIFNIHDPENNK